MKQDILTAKCDLFNEESIEFYKNNELIGYMNHEFFTKLFSYTCEPGESIQIMNTELSIKKIQP